MLPFLNVTTSAFTPGTTITCQSLQPCSAVAGQNRIVAAGRVALARSYSVALLALKTKIPYEEEGAWMQARSRSHREEKCNDSITMSGCYANARREVKNIQILAAAVVSMTENSKRIRSLELLCCDLFELA